jgi:hypothetical protein
MGTTDLEQAIQDKPITEVSSHTNEYVFSFVFLVHPILLGSAF